MAELVPEGSLEQLVPEQDFVGLLAAHSGDLLRLASELLADGDARWTKRQFFQLYSEADELESFLDDYGARYNQAYCYLTELVASMRGFSMAGLSLEHLVRRLDGYGVLGSFGDGQAARVRTDVRRARSFVQATLVDLLQAVQAESAASGVEPPSGGYAQGKFEDPVVRFRLPSNVGHEEIEDEEQRIAEVASKYIQACTMLEEAGLSRLSSGGERDAFIAQNCTEEQARVYEATVHNLQSAYDTYVKNTVLEAQDERLPLLRGHFTASLHLLEAVTQLVHFVERHESEVRDDEARRRLSELVPRAEVLRVTLDILLHWADRFMQQGRELAEELLPAYTNLQTLEIELCDGLLMHARPASLIVSVVNHYGTPVEMELEGQTCNAGSILELLVVVGSHPETRAFLFRGDEHPLRDIGLLFEHGFGEQGAESLPESLEYLGGRF